MLSRNSPSAQQDLDELLIVFGFGLFVLFLYNFKELDTERIGIGQIYRE